MNDKFSTDGMLYIVATPIGNLGDISQRAVQTLSDCDLILAEDTRHSRYLMQHYGITTHMRSCHEHNEEQRVDEVLELLKSGSQVALISDAGTPLISDPGFVLVRAVRQAGFVVSPIPGASSIITALCASGLPTDRFIYDGFLPAKRAARQTKLKTYLNVSRTIVLLESSHRILDALHDLSQVLGSDRRIVLARELTKKFETVLDGTVDHVIECLKEDDNQTRGEFVLLIEGVEEKSEDEVQQLEVLKVLLEELPVKQASAMTAKITGQRKNDVYKTALSIMENLNNGS